MSDDWEEFMDARDGIERKVYHFYWSMFSLYMIKDNEGNILAGTGLNTWEERPETPGRQKARGEKIKQLREVREQARKEKKEGRAYIIIHEVKRRASKKKAKRKVKKKAGVL